MLYILSCCIGLIIGYSMHKFLSNQTRLGNIIVSKDEDGTYLSLEINSISEITSKDEVLLGVRHTRQ